MTNASRENSILRFQPFASRLQIHPCRMRVDKKAMQNLPSKRGTGTRDEAP